MLCSHMEGLLISLMFILVIANTNPVKIKVTEVLRPHNRQSMHRRRPSGNLRNRESLPEELEALINPNSPHPSPPNRTELAVNGSRIMQETTTSIYQREDDCIACEKLRQELFKRPTAEELRQARLESVKRTILEKLNMKHPPNVTRTISELPEPLLEKHREVFQFHEHFSGAETEDYYGETEQVSIFAHSVTPCGRGGSDVCFKMTIKKELHEMEIDSAMLYVKYQPIIDDDEDMHHPLRLSDVTGRREMFLQEEVTNENVMWTPFSIKQQVKHRVVNSFQHRNITFKISCHQCEDLLIELRRYRPYLQLQTHEASHRTKRSINQCSEQESTCCKTTFRVSFSEIGWDSWIISPEGYFANYCSGSCVEMDHMAFPHTKTTKAAAKQMQKHIQDCCMPIKMSPISLLFTDTDGNIIMTNVPNMVVESCGCG